MDVSLQSLINLYVFSTGRRLFALAQVMKAAASEPAFPELAAHCAVALKQDRQTRALETQWAAPAAGRPSPVQPIDVKLDRALVSFRDAAKAHADSEDEDDDVRNQVRAMLTAIFPLGVLDVIQKPYVEQLSAVDGILETLKNKKYASLVADLGLGRIVKRIVKLTAEYRAAMEAPAVETVAFDKVRAARAQGQELLLEAVVMILGKYPTPSAEHVAARTALLGPILKQNDAVGAYLRARRSVQDVNPDTGAIDPNAPSGDAPAPAGTAEKSPA